MNIRRLADSITISRRLHNVINAPRAIPCVDTLLPLLSAETDCCSFLAMVQMVGDGLVTLDRERWN